MITDNDIALLAFGPHPDDVEICAAGTLLKTKAMGHRVGIVDLTAGEMGTRGTREIRYAEQVEASRKLGLDLRLCLDLGDGNLSVTRENELAIVRVIRKHRPQVVLLPWKIDDHPDHEAAAVLIRNACFLSGMSKIEPALKIHRPEKLLYYAGRRDFEPDFVVDITDYWKSRQDAASSYKSQFYNPDSKEDSTKISSPDFWHFIEARSMYYGQLIGKRYGEGFICDDMLEINNPIDFFNGK
jgi:N-acetylglucosamine malate deacetylase 1